MPSADDTADARKVAWLDHGCKLPDLYGDDGEMQCCRCYGLDFKRSPWPVLVRRLGVLRNASIQRAEAAESKLRELEQLLSDTVREVQDVSDERDNAEAKLQEAEAEREELRGRFLNEQSRASQLSDQAEELTKKLNGAIESAIMHRQRNARSTAQLAEAQQRVDQSHEVALREAAALTCPSCRRPEMFLPAERDGNYWLHKLRRAPESDHAECRAGYILAAITRPEAPTPVGCPKRGPGIWAHLIPAGSITCTACGQTFGATNAPEVKP